MKKGSVEPSVSLHWAVHDYGHIQYPVDSMKDCLDVEVDRSEELGKVKRLFKSAVYAEAACAEIAGGPLIIQM